MKFQFLPENFSRSENAPPFETRKIRHFEVERIFLENKKMVQHFLPKVDLAEILKGSLQHGNLDIAYEVCRNPKNKSAICGCSVPSSLRHIGKTDRNDRQDNVRKIAHILKEGS